MKYQKHSRGVTLVELMATLSVAAVVLTLGVPSFRSVQLNMQRAQVGSSLTASFTLARSEAARRAVSVTVCPTTNGTSCRTETTPDWKTGWLVFTDLNGNGIIDDTDELLSRERFEAPPFTLAAAPELGTRITFSSTGVLGNAGGFTYSDGRQTCRLHLNALGRIEPAPSDPRCG